MKLKDQAKSRLVSAPVLVALVLLSLLYFSFAGTQTAGAEGAVTVSRDWAHTPPGLQGGDSFRLLFVTSTTRDASSTDIGDYNRHVQGAADSNDNLKPFKSEIRVVGSTPDVDARDNTGTTGEGVRIYWVGGEKVADNYADFYDGTWDSYAAKNESGNTQSTDLIFTGSTNAGVKQPLGNEGGPLGWDGSFRGFAGTMRNPITTGKLETGRVIHSNGHRSDRTASKHFYALSPVITVEDSVPVAGDWRYVPSGLSVGDSFRLLFMTSTAHSAMSVSEQDYIGVVKWRADTNAALRPYQDDFSALVSTQYHDARDLTRTNTEKHGRGVPIYWLNGEKVADDYADFYCGGGWDSQVARNEQGKVVERLGDRYVWTGSHCNGTKVAYKYLSSEHPTAGKLAGTNGGASKEIDSGFTRTKTDQHHLYGLSPIFTVATAPPPVRRQAPATTPTATPAPTATPSAPLPAVQLRAKPLRISENGGVSTIEAWLDSPAPESITITISAIERYSNEARADVFTLSANRTLTIAAGEDTSTGVVTVTAVDNTRVGSACCTWEDEVDVIVSGTVTGSTRPVSDVWMEIKDDDPVGGL